MKKFFPVFAPLVLLVFFSLSAGAAETAPAPTRESLIAFWEERTLNDPEVKRFEKTSAQGVYNFETGFFPYKGRLKLLNAAITRTSDGYYDGFYTGIVEVELPDAPQDFFRKYAASYGAWTSQNYFYYDAKKAEWFHSSEWGTRFSSDAATPASCPLRSFRDVFWISFLVLVVGTLAVFVRRQNKRIWDNHATALAEQQRGLKIAEESLLNQKEQIKLLKEISEFLGKNSSR